MNTIDLLNKRIEERFPESGLSKVGKELSQIALETQKKIDRIGRPNWWLRLSLGGITGFFLVVLVFSISSMDINTEDSLSMVELASVVEASVNDIVLIGAALFFLFTLEGRVKRQRALSALHELRSMAHVIDMHQLTKDPTDQQFANTYRTASSPVRELTGFELGRYLDYCSEMLALLGKMAALYTQSYPDQTVLSSVNEVEDLCTGISGKIWQKIMILQNAENK